MASMLLGQLFRSMQVIRQVEPELEISSIGELVYLGFLS